MVMTICCGLLNLEIKCGKDEWNMLEWCIGVTILRGSVWMEDLDVNELWFFSFYCDTVQSLVWFESHVMNSDYVWLLIRYDYGSMIYIHSVVKGLIKSDDINILGVFLWLEVVW